MTQYIRHRKRNADGTYEDLIPDIAQKAQGYTSDGDIATALGGKVTTTGTMTANHVVTSNGGTVIKDSGYTIGKSVPSDAKFTDTTYDVATTSANGLMSSGDKSKLNGIATGAEVNVQSDWNESNTSSDAYIKNKPTIPTIPSITIDTSGSGNVISNVTASGHALTLAKSDTLSATQTGGISKTYTTGANTTRVVLARVNSYSGNASCRIKLEVSGSGGIKTAYIDAVWAGTGHTLTIESVYSGNNAIRYFYCVVPNNANYYTSNPPEIHIQQTTGVARTVKATILERSGDVVLMDNLTTTGNTTNRNTRTYDVNNTVGIYDNTGYVQNCGWAGGSWDRLDNDRYLFGENVANLTLGAVATDGKVWKLSNTSKEFLLPLDMGNCTGTFSAGATYGRMCKSIRGLGWANFTNTTAQTTAFTVPTLTANDYGKFVYLVGSINNGNFKSSRKVTLSMDTPQSGSVTYIPIGKVDRVNEDLTKNPVPVPSTWTFIGYNTNAYTIDSNGRLTHINGKEIKDADLSISSSGTGNVVSEISFDGHAISYVKGVTALTSHQSLKTINNTAITGTGNVSVGTVTEVKTGVGLTGGTITGSGTVKAKLMSETPSTLDSGSISTTANRQYAVGVDKSGYLSVNVPWSNTTYSAMSVYEGRAGTSATYRTMRADYLKEMVLEIIYPVGSVYINASDSTNPATLLGFGTWEQIGEGNVLLAGSQNGTYKAGSPYGSNTTSSIVAHNHTFTTGAAGEHTHYISVKDSGQPDGWEDHGGNQSIRYWNSSNDRGWTNESHYTNSDGYHSHNGTTNSTGNSSISIMQQSIAVYMWKRTA